MNEPIVRLEFTELISENRYVVDALTPEMLTAIRDRVYNDHYLTERITEAVDDALRALYPELERDTDDDGNYKIEVVLEIYNERTRNQHSETLQVLSSDLASAEDEALFIWKQMNDWHDGDGKIVVQSVEWVND